MMAPVSIIHFQASISCYQTFNIMFGLFKKDPAKQLRQQYEKLLEEARDLQRKGDIKGYAQKSAEAEAVAQQLEAFLKP